MENLPKYLLGGVLMALAMLSIFLFCIEDICANLLAAGMLVLAAYGCRRWQEIEPEMIQDDEP